MTTGCMVELVQNTAPPPLHDDENVVTTTPSAALLLALLPLMVHPEQLKLERSKKIAPENR